MMGYKDFCVQVQGKFGGVVFETKAPFHNTFVAKSINSPVPFEVHYHGSTGGNRYYLRVFETDYPQASVISYLENQLLCIMREHVEAIESFLAQVEVACKNGEN